MSYTRKFSPMEKKFMGHTELTLEEEQYLLCINDDGDIVFVTEQCLCWNTGNSDSERRCTRHWQEHCRRCTWLQ